jgi:hypothetical protein
LSRKQGFLPKEHDYEDITKDGISTESAKVGKARNESSERALSSTRNMGFEPLDLSTEGMKDQKLNYGIAAQDSQKKTKAKAERNSITEGMATIENEAKEFKPATDKFDRGEEKVARNQSNERAIIQTQTMGFLTETEGTSFLPKSDKLVEEKNISSSQVESLKGRATSRPRIHGFEPLLENAEEASSDKIPTVVAQKGEVQIHESLVETLLCL